MTGLRHILVDDPIQILFDKKMVVTVKHDVHTVFHKKLMQRHLPAWTVLFEALAAVGVLAAPFHVVSRFGSTPHIPPQPANQVVNEHEPHRRLAAREHVGQPAILSLAKRHVPTGRSALHGRPKGIKPDKERVAPLKSKVAVLVVPIRGIRKIGVTLAERPLRHHRITATLAIMIAQHHENRHTVRDPAHVIALRLVLRLCAAEELAEFIHHRRVAQVDHKIRLIRQHVVQRLLINPHIGVVVEMRVRLHDKAEARSCLPLCVKAAHHILHRLTPRAAVGDTVVVARVRLQTTEHHVLRDPGLEFHRCRLQAVTILKKRLHLLPRQHADRHRFRTRPAKPHIEQIRRHLRRLHLPSLTRALTLQFALGRSDNEGDGQQPDQ